jgi:hypothetical protein
MSCAAVREAEVDKDRAERELNSLTPSEKPRTEAEIRALVRSQSRVLRSLARATQNSGPRSTAGWGCASPTVPPTEIASPLKSTRVQDYVSEGGLELR